jgi:hypothetical protein
MSTDEILKGLKSGRKLRCDRKDEPLLPWLLAHPQIENSGVVQLDQQLSYIEFWWNDVACKTVACKSPTEQQP